MAGQFRSKVALVTGGGSGIGRATALAFARADAQVMVADLNCDLGMETVELIEARNGTAAFVRADVSKAPDVISMVARAIGTYGRLDCAFNNAGIDLDRCAIPDMAEEDWQRVIAVNLTGVYRCLKYEIPRMLPRGGAIVNTSSGLGLVGGRGNAAYVASKHGVIGLTKAAALEWATSGIRVNAVCPGWISTPMVEQWIARDPGALPRVLATEPVGRLGTADEVAAAVLWLCSDAASFVTGAAMPVDGGAAAQVSSDPAIRSPAQLASFEQEHSRA